LLSFAIPVSFVVLSTSSLILATAKVKESNCLTEQQCRTWSYANEFLVRLLSIGLSHGLKKVDIRKKLSQYRIVSSPQLEPAPQNKTFEGMLTGQQI
jgi:hypothetical protein